MTTPQNSGERVETMTQATPNAELAKALMITADEIREGRFPDIAPAQLREVAKELLAADKTREELNEYVSTFGALPPRNKTVQYIATNARSANECACGAVRLSPGELRHEGTLLHGTSSCSGRIELSSPSPSPPPSGPEAKVDKSQKGME